MNVGFLVLGLAFLFLISWKSIRHTKRFFKLKNQNNRIKAKVIFVGPPSGWRLSIPKVKYKYENEVYETFVVYTYFGFYFNKVDEEYEIYVDKDNPEICMFTSPGYVIMDISIILAFITLICLVANTIPVQG